jgi:hypothetical protein
MTRIDGGVVGLAAAVIADGAKVAVEGLRAATPAAPRPPDVNVWTYQPVPSIWSRATARLFAQLYAGMAQPRGYAPGAEAAAPSASGVAAKATASSPLDFIRDSRLSAEEKLVLLLAQQQKDTEKEIETVLKKAEAKSKQKSGGVLSKVKVFDVVKSVVPALATLEKFGLGKVARSLAELSGPVLAAGATALGMPHLAPLALSLGPDLLAKLDAEIPVGEAKATASAPNAGTGSSNALDPVETQRLTLLVNRQQQWAGTVSNLLHNLHQTRMNVIQNLR